MKLVKDFLKLLSKISIKVIIEDKKYKSILDFLSSIGYDIAEIKDVPQDWD